MESRPRFFDYLAIASLTLILGLGIFGVLDTVWNDPRPVFSAGGTQTVTTTVIVDNASPVVSAVFLNDANAITLTANATTTIYVRATISDNNGCDDITNGTTTVLVYRSGYTSSTCLTTADNRSCYRATAFTATSTCASGTMNATSSVDIYYFADSTQDAGSATSTYPTQNWFATVIFKDPSNSTHSLQSTATSTDVNVLTALNITTSSINYGTLAASSTTGSTNQTATTTNAGNSTSTARIKANATLTSGSNSLATSSQRYGTSTFTYVGASTALTDTDTTITGFTMVTPTSTTNVSKVSFWGLEVVAGKPTGTYSGVNLFTALYLDIAN